MFGGKIEYCISLRNLILLVIYMSHPINTTNIVEQRDFSNQSPLSGFGYGLPISEIYVNFFNSSCHNIKIISNNNKTSVYIYLRNLKLSWC